MLEKKLKKPIFKFSRLYNPLVTTKKSVIAIFPRETCILACFSRNVSHTGYIMTPSLSGCIQMVTKTQHYPIARAAKRANPILDISDKFDTSRTVHNTSKDPKCYMQTILERYNHKTV